MSKSPSVDWRERSTFYYHDRPIRRMAMGLLGPALAPLMKLHVEGLENVPAEGPVILASNHVTNFDVLPMQLATPRPIFFMSKAELFQVGPIGGLFREFGAFPVYRGGNDTWALRHAARVLDAGQMLGMFPEGTRSRGRGLGNAKTGAARLAIEACCPILPMVVKGTDRLLQSFPHRTRVEISFLPGILPASGDTPLSLTDQLMLVIAAALPEQMRGAYASIPA